MRWQRSAAQPPRASPPIPEGVLASASTSVCTALKVRPSWAGAMRTLVLVFLAGAAYPVAGDPHARVACLPARPPLPPLPARSADAAGAAALQRVPAAAQGDGGAVQPALPQPHGAVCMHGRRDVRVSMSMGMQGRRHSAHARVVPNDIEGGGGSFDVGRCLLCLWRANTSVLPILLVRCPCPPSLPPPPPHFLLLCPTGTRSRA